MAKGKFREQADNMNFALSMLQNSAIKKAMAAGVQAAGLATYHDSSNASVHWTAVPHDRPPRPSWKGARDLRATVGRGKGRKGKRPARFNVVGARRSYHEEKPEKLRAVKYLVARERKAVLDKYVVGRIAPTRKFYFYNSIEEGVPGDGPDTDLEEYAENAKLYSAGDAAVAAALRAAEEAFVAGFARSKFKK